MQKEKNKNVLRRTFLKKSARSTAAIASMTSAPAVWAAGFSPNETIGVGHIGIGVRGDDLVVQIAGDAKKDRPGVPKTQIRALCDVYQGHLDKGMRLCGNPNAKTYHDYQEMLVDQDIDAVVIATPDHWHAVQTVHASETGKHVFVEKPHAIDPTGIKTVRAACDLARQKRLTRKRN